MPRPRKAQVCLATTPYYHCMSRCVRRAYLCGYDEYTGKDYGHRRQQIENRILELGTIFSIDIASFAIMHSHYHVLLHVDKAQALAWDNREVIKRWQRIFKGNLFSQRYIRDEPLEWAEQDKLDAIVEEWRRRLYDLSWFMRCINEPMARQANFEDQCTGRFWEGRFISQGLLDEKALAAGLAYVDLNPLRAKIADTPEDSDHTSIQLRAAKAKEASLQARESTQTHIDLSDPLHQPEKLLPFAGNPRLDMPKGLPFRLEDYLDLVDWTGRQLRAGKRGSIASAQPSIMKRLNIAPQHWLHLTLGFEKHFRGYVGSPYALKKAYKNLGYQRTPSLANAQRFLQ